MALLTLAQIKADLRVESDAEDETLTRFLAEAIARVKAIARQRDTVLGTPVSTTFFPLKSYRDEHWRSVIVLPMWPVLASPLPVITDGDGVVVTSTNYTVTSRLARIQGIADYGFTVAPYTVVATVGLETDPLYTAEIEPVINTAIRDIVADKYQHRNPGSTSESTAGVSVSYDSDGFGIPERARMLLDDVMPLRPWLG